MQKTTRGLLAAGCSAWVLAACGPALELNPQTGSSFGQYQVTAKGTALHHLQDPLAVTVGGVNAYDVVRDSSDQVHFTIQGQDSPGLAEVVISGANGQTKSDFDYTPPATSALSRLVAIGASLTMGSQDASVGERGQLHGPAAQFARAAGAYLTLPLLKQDIMPSLKIADFDPKTCQLPPGTDIISLITQRGLADSMPAMTDAAGVIHLDRARVDPYVEVRNVAIGGYTISQVVEGHGGIYGTIMEHIIWDPFVDPALMWNEPKDTMLDRAVELNPTAIISTDLFVNDVNGADLTTSGIPNTSFLTSVASFQQSLDALLARLDPTGAELFLATSPDVTGLPGYAAKVASLEASGYTVQESTAWLETIRQRIADLNAALWAAAATRPKLHVVDVYAWVAGVFVNGVDVNGTHLEAKPFGGLLSLDGEHFSDTGYALLAQAFIDQVNQDLGAGIPSIDVAAVMATDPYSVASLKAAGLTCAGN